MTNFLAIRHWDLLSLDMILQALLCAGVSNSLLTTRGVKPDCARASVAPTRLPSPKVVLPRTSRSFKPAFHTWRLSWRRCCVWHTPPPCRSVRLRKIPSFWVTSFLRALTSSLPIKVPASRSPRSKLPKPFVARPARLLPKSVAREPGIWKTWTNFNRSGGWRGQEQVRRLSTLHLAPQYHLAWAFGVALVAGSHIWS